MSIESAITVGNVAVLYVTLAPPAADRYRDWD